MSERVAIVCGAGIVSGKEIMALELGQGLRDQGTQVKYVSAWWGNGEFRDRLRQRGFKNHILRLGFISATLTFPAIRMTLHQLIHWPGLLIGYARFLRSFRPDKVVQTNWHHALLLLPLLKPKRDIYWSHEIPGNNPLLRIAFRAIATRIHCLVAVSEASAAALRRLGIAESKIRVVYNGIVDVVYTDSREPKHSGARIGIVGQVGAWKGHDDLLDAFARVVTTYPQAELHIFGKGAADYEEYLRERCIQFDIESMVSWHGFVAEQKEIYSHFDICVVPSRVEDPLPTVAIEAALAGLPVVASRRGGLPEIVEDGVTGLLFDAGDIKQLASCLTRTISNVDSAAVMGNRGRIRAREKFNRQRFIRDFSEILSEPSPCNQ
jgi:glycosyltransferase involved in cell wall biosynthesis